jgi:hypothetical protein
LFEFSDENFSFAKCIGETRMIMRVSRGMFRAVQEDFACDRIAKGFPNAELSLAVRTIENGPIVSLRLSV